MQKKKHRSQVVTFDWQKKKSHWQFVNTILRAFSFDLAEVRWVMAKQSDVTKQAIAKQCSNFLEVVAGKLMLKSDKLCCYHISAEERKTINDKLSHLSNQFQVDDIAKKIKDLIEKILLDKFNDEEVIKDFHKVPARKLACMLKLKEENEYGLGVTLESKEAVFKEFVESGNNYLTKGTWIIQGFNAELHKKKSDDFKRKAFFANYFTSQTIEKLYVYILNILTLISLIVLAGPPIFQNLSSALLSLFCSVTSWGIIHGMLHFHERGHQRAVQALAPETEKWLSETFTLKKENDLDEQVTARPVDQLTKIPLKLIEPAPVNVQSAESNPLPFVPPRVERVRPQRKNVVLPTAPRQEEVQSSTSHLAEALRAVYKENNVKKKDSKERNIKEKRFFDLPLGETGYLDTQALKKQGVLKEEIRQIKGIIKNQVGHRYLSVDCNGKNGIKKVPKKKIKKFEFTDPVKKELVTPHSYIKNRNLLFRVRGSVHEIKEGSKECSVVVYNFAAPK